MLIWTVQREGGGQAWAGRPPEAHSGKSRWANGCGHSEAEGQLGKGHGQA